MKKRKVEEAPREAVKRPKVVRAQRKFAQGVIVPVVTKDPPRLEQPKEEKEKNEMQEFPKIPIDKYLNIVTFGNIVYKNPYAVIEYTHKRMKDDPVPISDKTKIQRTPPKKLTKSPVTTPVRSRVKRVRVGIKRQIVNTKPRTNPKTLQPVVRVLRKYSEGILKRITNRLTRQSLLKFTNTNLNSRNKQPKKLRITRNMELRSINKPRVVLRTLSKKDKTPIIKKNVSVSIAKQIISSPTPKIQPDFSSEDEIPLKRTRTATPSTSCNEQTNMRPARRTKDKANVYIKSLSANRRNIQIENRVVNLEEKKVYRKSTPVLVSETKTRSKSGVLPKKSFTDSDEEPLALKISDLENGTTHKQLTTQTKIIDSKKLSKERVSKMNNIIVKKSKSKLNHRRVVKLRSTQNEMTDNMKERSIGLKSIVIRKNKVLLRACKRPFGRKQTLGTFKSTSISKPKNGMNQINDKSKAVQKRKAVKRKTPPRNIPESKSNNDILLRKQLQVNKNVEKWLEEQPMPLQEISGPCIINCNDAVFKRPPLPNNKTHNMNKRHSIPATNLEEREALITNDLSWKLSDIACTTEKPVIDVDELVNIDSISEYATNTKSRCNDCSSCKTLLSAIKRLERLISFKGKPTNLENDTGDINGADGKISNNNQITVRAEVHKESDSKIAYESENAIKVGKTIIQQRASFDQSVVVSKPKETKNENKTKESDNSKDSEGTRGSEDHLFYIRFPTESMESGINLDDHLIQAVTVKLPHQKSIVRAKLVNKAEINSKNQALQSKPLMANMASVDMLPNTSSSKDNEQDSSKSLILTVNLDKDVFHEPNESIRTQHVNTENLEHVSQIPSASISSSIEHCCLPRQNNVKKAMPDINPINKLTFPQKNGPARIVEAPIFRPSEKEFQDPLEFIESISSIASRYGICKIIPPKSFTPECRLSDDMRFKVQNQYIHKMLHRWGPSAREMCAIKKYLATQGVSFANPPLVGGIELDLPKLYHTVQNLGGLNEVIEKKKWPKVVDEMNIPISRTIYARVADIYLKYLLPYDTLSQAERQNIFQEVEKQWIHKEQQMLNHAGNPLVNNYIYDQKTQAEESETATGRAETSIIELANNREMEDCIIAGKATTLGAFKKTAKNAMHLHFSRGNSGQLPKPTPAEVETAFWNHVTSREEHVCVNAASIDSGTPGYGFPNTKTKCSSIFKHPWNLKVLTNNSGSVLRSLGALIGVTVPTIHVGMVFSTCCWYRDPHGLSWIEYLHKGAPKIWYSVPDCQSEKFRRAVETLVPSYCLSKKIWLPSDMTMVPPTLLIEQDVSLGQTVQQPGEFVVVFPKAYTSSISTGYLVSESVFFAHSRWLQSVDETFKDLRDSCEPTIFSLESLLISMANDTRWPVSIVSEVYVQLKNIVKEEAKNRSILLKMGVEVCNLFDNSDNFCLQHAISLYKKAENTSLQTRLVYMWTMEELKEILTKIEHRAVKT